VTLTMAITITRAQVQGRHPHSLPPRPPCRHADHCAGHILSDRLAPVPPIGHRGKAQAEKKARTQPALLLYRLTP
jgi:hypothetical protein